MALEVEYEFDGFEPNLTAAQVNYYLGTYRLIRERQTLPSGWTDEVHADPDDGEFVLCFREGEDRVVNMDICIMGMLNVTWKNLREAHWTVREVVDLLNGFIGVELIEVEAGGDKYEWNAHSLVTEIPDTVFNC